MNHPKEKSLPANDLMPLVWQTELEDYIVDLRWSAGGKWLAAMPAEGCAVVFDPGGTVESMLEPHAGGNGSLAWHPHRQVLATVGQDGCLRFYESSFASPKVEIVLPGVGWTERCMWNATGSFLAALRGGNLVICAGERGEIIQTISLSGTFSDLYWNPAREDELATSGPLGLHFWRVGESAPTGHFPLAGAQRVNWSTDGRWVALGNMEACAYLLDRRKGEPLRIQGYDSKVSAFRWDAESRWLASASGGNILVWPCDGEFGPRGVMPLSLLGHYDRIEAVDFAPDQAVLVSGGRDGLLLIWMPERSLNAGIILRRVEAITQVRFCPTEAELAYATASGEVGLCAFAES